MIYDLSFVLILKYLLPLLIIYLLLSISVGNYQEQLAPFLISLYLYATFVSVHGAVKFGWAWIFFRSYYISVFKRGPPLLFLSTIPAYWCVWMMIGGTIYRLSVK